MAVKESKVRLTRAMAASQVVLALGMKAPLAPLMISLRRSGDALPGPVRDVAAVHEGGGAGGVGVELGHGGLDGAQEHGGDLLSADGIAGENRPWPVPLTILSWKALRIRDSACR